MSKTTILYVARHGTTDLNAAGSFRGHVDVPLDSQGHRDAQNLADFFKDINISHIVSSDKIRAMQTANAIGESKNLKVLPTSSLHPWDVGMFSGKPKNNENMAKLEQFISNPNRPIPDGEALNAFKSRVRPCLAEAMDMSMVNCTPILVVGHSSIVHEVSDLINGDHLSCLVYPGGVIAVYVENGRLGVEPLFKTKSGTSRKADTVS